MSHEFPTNIRSLVTAGALSVATLTAVAPIAEATPSQAPEASAKNPDHLVLDAMDCVPALYIPRSGPAQAGLRVNFTRRYEMNGQDITESLRQNPRPVVETDLDGATTEYTGLQPEHYDYQWSLQEDPRQRTVTRPTFTGNETRVLAPEVAKKGDEIVVVANEVVFSAEPKANSWVEVVDRCGVKQLRRKLTAVVNRIARGGRLVAVANNQKEMAEDCILNDELEVVHHVTEKEQPKPEATATPKPTPGTRVPVQGPPVQGPFFEIPAENVQNLSDAYNSAPVIENPNQLGRVLD